MRYLSVCSGMEAASVAWHPLGWTPVGFSEIEPFPCAILKHRFPHVPNYGSLTEHHTWPIEQGAIDLLVGGTPCQSFSVAGLRKGLADPRGNLALTFLGLADRLKPKWIVWENVPGVLSSNGGRDFGSFLGALVELGYGFAYRVLDAQHFGVPQRRRRVFLVACLGDWRAPAEVLSLREGLRGYLEAGGKKRKGVAADAGSGAEAGCWWDGGQVSQTLDAVLSKGQTMPEKNRFPAVLQPKPVVIDRAAFNQGVNAQFDPHIAESEVMDSLVARGPHAVGQPLPIPFRKSKRAASTTDNETWVPADVTNTLNNFDLGDTRTTHAVVGPLCCNTGPNGNDAGNFACNQGVDAGHIIPVARTTHAVVEPHIVQASELRLRGQITEQKTVPTLLANTKSGDNDPLAVHAITFQPGNLRREAGAEPSTTTTTTLKASAGDQTPHVAYSQGVDLYNQTLTGDLHVPLRTAGGHGAPATLQAMAVRRLTPNECYRLQGFPDNWGRIPWKGKPAEECPDGPQYKAAGNSMAVPCMFWIGQRIAAVEASSHA